MKHNGTAITAEHAKSLHVENSLASSSDETKMKQISFHFRRIMEALGLNVEYDSLKETPARVAKMYVKEIFKGLDPANEPSITHFDNSYGYSGMVLERNIRVQSWCEHHFVPITGKAHVAYYSSGRIIGLSKLNRIVEYFSSRPQVQERLTEDIAAKLKEVLQTEDVAVVIDAVHHCVVARGVEDVGSSTYTAHFSGKFLSEEIKREFLSVLK